MSAELLTQLSTLIKRQSTSGLLGIKSEFESEGIRQAELITLNILVKSLGLATALKIGGAEAKTDLLYSMDTFTDYVIAPMIESPYAAYKCMEMYKSAICDRKSVAPKLLINIETTLALQNLELILDKIQDVASGVVFGRVDFTLSSGLTRQDIPSDYVNESVLKVSQVCKDRDLEFVLGGGVSVDSVAFLREVSSIRLDRFETRKCLIDSVALATDSIYELLQDCVLIELLWLKYKSSSYSLMTSEDANRIEMLEKRHLFNISSCTN